jgi:hypothetical protein
MVVHIGPCIRRYLEKSFLPQKTPGIHVIGIPLTKVINIDLQPKVDPGRGGGGHFNLYTRDNQTEDVMSNLNLAYLTQHESYKRLNIPITVEEVLTLLP